MLQLYLLILMVVTAASSAEPTTPPTTSTPTCSARVCISFDGSAFVSSAAFEGERQFGAEVAEILRGSCSASASQSKIGAVQYGTVARPVSVLTSDHDAFVRNVTGMVQLGGESNVNGGLAGCRLVLESAGVTEMPTAVLLVAENASLGGDVRPHVSGFRALGGIVHVVATSRVDTDALQEVVGSSGRVFIVDTFENLESMTKVSELVRESLCTPSVETGH